jgi:protein-S-isoprenylcysteine O-methyltransferase Ste14
MSALGLGRRLFFLVYGLVCYAAFLGVIGYACGFVGDFWGVLGLKGPFFRAMDAGRAEDGLAVAWAIDLGLLGLFALQHSVMARRGFKEWWTRLVPAAIERSTYVLASSLALALLFWQWRPLGTGVVWEVSSGPWQVALVVLSGLGWLTALQATFMIDHFELFGVKQVWRAFRGLPAQPSDFVTPGLYRIVRHPLYTGFLIAFWATPRMTVGHLVFALGTTLYTLVAVRLEERDLLHTFGDTYRAYQQRVRMLVPLPPVSRQPDERAEAPQR